MPKVIMSGAGGLVGGILAERFKELGWEMLTLTRGDSSEGRVHWNPLSGELDAAGLEGCHYVVHLAGESISTGRWTQERKRMIMDSREKSTRLLAETLARQSVRPLALLCASGSNYYRDCGGGPPWDESGPAGNTFLAQVCRRWEAAADPAREAGIRVIHARMGAVLSIKGGLLPRILPGLCAGLFGVANGGSQRMSWIHHADLGRAIAMCLAEESISGPVNVTSPIPVTNKEFIHTAAGILRRPCFLPMPATAIRWFFGEMGEELMLADNATVPARLILNGMQWDFADIHDALTDIIGPSGCRQS
jgi:hypothetical protein